MFISRFIEFQNPAADSPHFFGPSYEPQERMSEVVNSTSYAGWAIIIT